ncbi:MAG: (d)CMP kinase [Acidobacteriota bacterium]
MSSTLIVAIDGPSGVGKSTVARQLAKRLRVPVLDTGAMYRAVALKMHQMEVDSDDGEAVERMLEDLDLELRPDADGGVEVRLDGLPVDQKIRTAEIADAASRVSRHSVVRRRMVELQRQVARRSGAVLEGRDIGTVVFPDTPHKFFLTARAEVRAERRHRELVASGKGGTFDDVHTDILRRDERDQQRTDSPLRVDDSYFEIDTSDLKPAEIVERMVGVIRRAAAQAEDSGSEAAQDAAAALSDPQRDPAAASSEPAPAEPQPSEADAAGVDRA